MTTGEAAKAWHLQRTEIDGVPVFYVDTDQTPAAVLSFRAGFADERLATRGWLHLLEHLAMTDRDDPSFHTNASVGPLLTEFQVHGEPEDVIAFLGGVCQWLADPAIHDLDHERRILEAEAAKRQYGDVTGHLDYRYGAVGIGTSNYPEFGLRTATPDDVRALAARYFVAGNAALALNVAPPEGLRLPLRSGARVPIPSAEPLPLHLPGHAFSATGDLAVSGLVDDSRISVLLGEFASWAVNQRLRHELGSSYGCQSHVERVDERLLQVTLVADVVEAKRAEGVELMYSTLSDLYSNGITEDALEPLRTRMLRQLKDVPDGAWQAFNSAQTHLRGADPVLHSDVSNFLSTVSVDALRRQYYKFLETAIYTSPAGRDSVTRLPFNVGFAEIERRATGRSFRPWCLSDTSKLELTRESIHVTGGEVPRGRSFNSVAAYLRYPDGARAMVNHDGGTLFVEPNVWMNGGRAVVELDAAIESSVHVPMDARPDVPVSLPPLPLRIACRFSRVVPLWVTWLVLTFVGGVVWVAWVPDEERGGPPEFLLTLYSLTLAVGLWRLYRYTPDRRP